METIKILAGIGTTLKGKLLVCDFSDMEFNTLDISKNTCCPVCHGEPSAVAGGERLVWLCGKDTANINPETPLKKSLNDLYPVVSEKFTVRLRSRLALMFIYKAYQVSLFSGGRMLIKGVTEEKMALQIYREIMRKLNQPTE